MIATGLPKHVLSIGEAMVELAPMAEAGQFSMGFAGDSFNTAWYLRRSLPADWTVDYLTAVGQDGVSGRLLDFLKASGVGTGAIAQLPDRTVGLYMIELQDGERSFSYWRGQSAARLMAADPGHLAQAMAGAGVIYLSGITIAVLENPGRANLYAALDTARAAGALVAFDPNLRPRLWPDAETMRTEIMTTATRADIILPSHEDEATHFGDTDPAATAARYAQAGAAMVVVKNGGGEMLSLAEGQGAIHAPEIVTNVVDSTAAGDSFNAAFLATWLTGADLKSAIRAGAKQAAHVIGRRGALCP
ncbi:MAG: sugar kinase [Pseudorhodobacter sp.]